MVMEVYIKFIMVILFHSAMMQCKTSFTRKMRWVVERENHKIARTQGRRPHKNVDVNRQIILKMLHLILSINWDVGLLFWVYMILLAVFPLLSEFIYYHYIYILLHVNKFLLPLSFQCNFFIFYHEQHSLLQN